MATSSISRINIVYSDGSYDNISLIQNGKYPLFSLDRQQEGDAMVSLGAHSSGAIATLLFMTAISNQRTEYSSRDPRVAALIQSWIAVTKEKSI